MENASKALIIAGGMLIAMMIVGLLVFGYNQIRQSRQSNVQSEELQQIAEFNQKLESYNKTAVRGYQMISLANLAQDFNNRYSEDSGYEPIDVIVKMQKNARLPGATDDELYTENKDYYDVIKYVRDIYPTLNENRSNEFKQLYFECTNVVYDENANGRITRMEFNQVKVSYSI